MTMHNPPHPGEVLREEFLAPLSLSVNALALALRVPATRIHEIVKERRGVSPDTAERLKPWYGKHCKRVCFHDDYLPAFNRPNVHLVDTDGRGVEAITAENNRPERKQHFLRDFRQRIEGGRGLIENGHSFPHNQIRESFG